MAEILEQTDEDLARLARSGSVDCFEALVRRFQVPLLRFLQRRAPNRHDAEDVIQETFLRAYRSLESYREDQPFKPWIYTIAYRLAIDGARRNQKHDRRLFQNHQMPMHDRADGGGTSPLGHAAENDSKSQLWELVRRTLKEEPFTAVWLHYGESLSTEEIAGITGRSRVWVKTALLRARGRIKVALEKSALDYSASPRRGPAPQLAEPDVNNGKQVGPETERPAGPAAGLIDGNGGQPSMRRQISVEQGSMNLSVLKRKLESAGKQ